MNKEQVTKNEAHPKEKDKSTLENFTFCISFLPSECPIITDDLQARDASIARTFGGQIESAVSDL